MKADATTITIDGQTYGLGCLPRRAAVGSLYPVFGAADRPETQIIPRKDWASIDFRHLVPKILDQDGQGACNAFASIQALHVIRNMAGLPFVELSPGNLYGRINGGVDRGSVIADAVQQLEDVGVCKAATVPPLEWRRSRWPSTWKDEAKRFRILEAYDCPTFDHIASALLMGFPVNFGILVGNNFRPDETGWLPDYRSGGGGHAMCAVGLAYHPSRRTWGLITANSWGRDWGLDGFCIVPESYFQRTPFTDAWAVRGTTDPTGDQ